MANATATRTRRGAQTRRRREVQPRMFIHDRTAALHIANCERALRLIELSEEVKVALANTLNSSREPSISILEHTRDMINRGQEGYEAVVEAIDFANKHAKSNVRAWQELRAMGPLLGGISPEQYEELIRIKDTCLRLRADMEQDRILQGSMSVAVKGILEAIRGEKAVDEEEERLAAKAKQGSKAAQGRLTKAKREVQNRRRRYDLARERFLELHRKELINSGILVKHAKPTLDREGILAAFNDPRMGREVGLERKRLHQVRTKIGFRAAVSLGVLIMGLFWTGGNVARADPGVDARLNTAKATWDAAKGLPEGTEAEKLQKAIAVGEAHASWSKENLTKREAAAGVLRHRAKAMLDQAPGLRAAGKVAEADKLEKDAADLITQAKTQENAAKASRTNIDTQIKNIKEAAAKLEKLNTAAKQVEVEAQKLAAEEARSQSEAMEHRAEDLERRHKALDAKFTALKKEHWRVVDHELLPRMEAELAAVKAEGLTPSPGVITPRAGGGYDLRIPTFSTAGYITIALSALAGIIIVLAVRRRRSNAIRTEGGAAKKMRQDMDKLSKARLTM